MLRDEEPPPEVVGAEFEPEMPKGLRLLTAILPWVIVVVVSLVAALSAPGLRWASMLAAAPALAAVRYTPRGVLLIGGVSVALAAVLGMRSDIANDRPQVLAALVAVTLVSALGSELRRRRERTLAAVRSVSEAAQQAVLAPVPERVGALRCAVTYNAAAAEARIGGDLYAVVETPHGVRALIADVRGKGLPAVRTAAQVFGVFREAAYDEEDLLEIVHRVERSLSRSLGGDDFVTALVAGFPKPHGLELVNCGHQPPFWIRDGRITVVEPVATVPPLGLAALGGDRPVRQVLPFEPGDQLLLYTDGVTEARDAEGFFYPLADRLPRLLAREPETTLAAVRTDLTSHAGGRLRDDAAMLLLQRTTD
ncbi:PP2C family protein-serine/threonine phosphatase [Streptomyces tardus]|nr:PP2C family protein-serine/threonine phosphatase [Streptomyces tardus]